MSDAQIYDHSKEYLDAVAESLDAALEAIGIHLAGEAQEELSNSPKRIDTGLLRNSITYALDGEPPEKTSYSADEESKYGKKGKPSGSYSGSAPKESSGRSVIVGSNVEYALYVHEGTARLGVNG